MDHRSLFSILKTLSQPVAQRRERVTPFRSNLERERVTPLGRIRRSARPHLPRIRIGRETVVGGRADRDGGAAAVVKLSPPHRAVV
jgi:hypothetical protein